MKHPQLQRNSRLSATLPSPDGGLNCGVSPFLIGDREISDCENLKLYNGSLVTRRGFVTDDQHFDRFTTGQRMQFFTDCDGYRLVLAAQDNEAAADLMVTVFDQNGVPTGQKYVTDVARGRGGFLVPGSTDSTLSRFTAILFADNGDIVGINAAEDYWVLLNDEVYVPLYAVNGTPTVQRRELGEWDRAEPINRLTHDFRCTYTTDNSGIYYHLPTLHENSPLTVTLTRSGRNITFEVESGFRESAVVEGLQVEFDRVGGCFWFLKNGAPTALPNDGKRNDVSARAWAGSVHYAGGAARRFGTWYGGDRSTTAGGTRLFLGGGNAVMWSAVGNPLYFPTSAYALVGDPDEPLTAFGKQGDQLVLFKQHSLYGVEYVSSQAATAEDIEQGIRVDVTATAQFPITPLHAQIGCDLPQTIALLGNRLVWACTDGKVYSLDTSGKLSQRTVSCISQPIRPLLQANAPRIAAATVVEDTYVLLWDNTLFVATDDPTPRWMKWSFDKTGATALSVCRTGRTLCIPASYEVGNTTVFFWFWQAGDADTAITHTGTGWADAVYAFLPRAVSGCLCTKVFDFGAPDEYKQITRVFADASADSTVGAAYVTERGTYPDVLVSAAHGVYLTPAVGRCRRFGLRLCGENLAVNSITIHAITGRR